MLKNACMKFTKLFFAIALSLSFQMLEAKVSLPYFIADNMVLQQAAKPLIWGWSTPQTKITVTTSWNNKKQSKNQE